MKRRDVVKAIWNMGNGITMGEWVDRIADEFISLHRQITGLERALAKKIGQRARPGKGEE